MTGFFDLHTHVLPGVDDGPETIEEAVELLRLAHAGGSKALVATPHMFMPQFGNYSTGAIRQAFADFAGAIDLMRRRDARLAFLDELELFLGAENFYSTEFVDAMDRGEVLTLNDGTSLLVELNPYLPFGAIEAMMRRIVAAGYYPVVAHVERYPELTADRARPAALAEMGCRLQVNAEGVMGSRLSRLRRTIFRLLASDQIAVVASDAHDTHSRPPQLDQTWEILAARFGAGRATAWLIDGPRRLVLGQSG